MVKLSGICLVPEAKVVRYLLNELHPDGAPKARFFKLFGFDPDRPNDLMNAISSHPEVNPVVNSVAHKLGLKSVVQCNLASPDGRNPCVLTVWILEHGTNVHRLVTAYPAKTVSSN